MLQLENISKRFGNRLLFHNVSLSLQEGDKVGIVAANGTGKSTLLNIIMGKTAPEEGCVTKRNGITMAYLPQKPTFSPGMKVQDACFSPFDATSKLVGEWRQVVDAEDTTTMERLLPLMEAQGAWDYERRAGEILHRLNITNISGTVERLSGGEQKRMALAGILIMEPDLILLDEPTNHLDVELIEWLERYLSVARLTILLVTHDRYFLDAVCNRIVELDDQTLYAYQGNYEYFLEKRKQRLESKTAMSKKLRNVYTHELEWMRRQPQARGGKQKARKEAFGTLSTGLKQIEDSTGGEKLALSAGSAYLGNKVIELHNLSHNYDTKQLIKDFSYTFSRKDRIGIIGLNGCGKTTLVKILMGILPPNKGHVEIGETVRFGYYAQTSPHYPADKRAIEVITDKAEQITDFATGITISAARLMERFLFDSERQYTPVEKLSGGELRRLYLCSVLMENPNILIFDEPTNDLDLVTLNILADYLQSFGGCVVIVSHDRFFMDRIVDHLFVFTDGGKVVDYPGTFTQYRQEVQQQELGAIHFNTVDSKESPFKAAPANQSIYGKTGTSSQSKASDTRRQQAIRQRKRTFKELQEYSALEEEIPRLEAKVESLQQQMSTGTMAPEALINAGREIEALLVRIDEKSNRWLLLSEIEP